MSINSIQSRIKEIREHFKLNQRDFASKIDVSQPTLAMFETGDRTIKEIHINRIITEFGINEDWLRMGEGDMFINLSENEEVIKYTTDLLLDKKDDIAKLITSFIVVYGKLDMHSKQVLKNFYSSLLEQIKKE